MVPFLVFLALVIAAASVGMLFEPGTWYTQLNKPAWTPPGWLFGPVWTVIYLMIATSGWFLWRVEPARPTPALLLWGVQLILNALWSWLFFGLHRIDLALVNIVLLWITILACAIVFRGSNVWASNLFVPYLVWVGFASALNFSIWRMN